MNSKETQELKRLTLAEIEYRKKWKKALSALNELVSPISKHNRECCEFWARNFLEGEIIVVMNTASYKITAPKLEPASVEAYLPYGIDFKDVLMINTDH